MRAPTGLETDAIIERLKRKGWIPDDPAPQVTDMAADLRECPHNAVDATAAIALSGQQARNEEGHRPGCGYAVGFYDRQRPGTMVFRRLPAKAKDCPGCRRDLERKLVATYAEVIGDRPVTAETVADATWTARQRRLSRAEVDYLRVPAPGGMSVLIREDPAGRANLHQVLVAAAAEMPADSRRVSASAAWRQAAGRLVDARKAEWAERYEYAGRTTVPIEHVAEVAKGLGLYLGEDGPDQPVVRVPADDPLAWRRFKRWIGLHDPKRERWRSEGKAA